MTDSGERLTGYHIRLFLFLSLTCFFEGWDFFALAQLLPELREHFMLSESQGGLLVAVINVGTILAYVVVRQADRWGRRRVLIVTILGYALFTGLSGLAWDVWSFGAFQLVARIFLIAEWVTVMVYAAEEFPASKRGLIIGVIQAVNSIGSIACAGLVPVLLDTVLGWRLIYLVGVVPMVLVAVSRRGLRESERFDQLNKQTQRRSLMAIWRSGHARRLLQMGAIWFLTYGCTQVAITFWKEFAQAERGFTDHEVGSAITVAAIAAMAPIFLAGKLLDVVGRRRGAAIIYSITIVSTVTSYTLETWWSLTISLMFGIIGATAVLPILSTYNAELFPTELRGDAYAWANNLIGRIAYCASPVFVGIAAESIGWGLAVASTAVLPAAALVMILAFLPETRSLELEQTAGM